MRVSKRDMADIHKLLSERRAHEEVQGYDPETLGSLAHKGLTVWHAFAFGTLIAFTLLWGAGVIGEVIAWAK